MRLHGGSEDLGWKLGSLLPEPNALMRMFLWLVHQLGGEVVGPRPVRVFYKFGSGGWRSRNTSQLHKVYRCR